MGILLKIPLTKQFRPVTKSKSSEAERAQSTANEDQKGTNGVSTNGVTANSMFFDRDFLGTPVNLLLSSDKYQGVPFSPQNFCSGPISVDPTCPQPKNERRRVALPQDVPPCGAYVCISLSLYQYIYIYIYMHLCMYVMLCYVM